MLLLFCCYCQFNNLIFDRHVYSYRLCVSVLPNGNLTFRHRSSLLHFDLMETNQIQLKRRLPAALSDQFMILYGIILKKIYLHSSIKSTFCDQWFIFFLIYTYTYTQWLSREWIQKVFFMEGGTAFKIYLNNYEIVTARHKYEKKY